MATDLNRVLTSMFVISLLLQLVAIVSPGWVIRDRVKFGLFYVISCESDCTTHSLPEFTEGGGNAVKEHRAYKFASDTLHALLPVIICIFCLISGLSTRRRQQSDSSGQIVVVVILTVAVVLQWELTAKYSHMNRMNMLLDAERTFGYIFPWAVFLYGISSTVTALTVFVVILSLLRERNGYFVPNHHTHPVLLSNVEQTSHTPLEEQTQLC